MRKNQLMLFKPIRNYLISLSIVLLFSSCAMLADFKYALDSSNKVDQYFIIPSKSWNNCSKTKVWFDEHGVIQTENDFIKDCPKEPVFCYKAETHNAITEYIKEIASEYYE